jgi:SpoVK/Ycf46/Vps4 family AAA+-type ATPase
MALTCAACGTSNRDTAKFCKHCGGSGFAAAGSGLSAAAENTPAGAANPAESSASLDCLVGLDEIKAELSGLKDILEGMKQNNISRRVPYNTIIIGGSGTAKTLIGKLITEILHTYGMISKKTPQVLAPDDLEKLNDKDLDALFDSAKGGVLFVDNADKLIEAESGRALNSFSRLIGQMDKLKDDPIVLLTGLPFGFREFEKKPENRTILGRFQKTFFIADYTPAQYTAIAEYELKITGFRLSPEAREKLEKRFRYLYKELKKAVSGIKENGYLALQEAQNISNAYFKRKATDKIILPDDIGGPVEEKKSIEEIMAGLNAIIGMNSLKTEIKSLYGQLKQIAEMEKQGAKMDKPAHHFVITGNPGTGKTTVARILGGIFEGLGLIDSGHVVEVDRSKMVAEYVGQTAPRVNTLCDQAMGGVLFVDEAYSLASGDDDKFGKEAIDTLLKRMEDERGKFVVIAAGYKMPMEKFLTANEGLKSRFTKYFNLEDYTPEELTAIFEKMTAAQHYIPGEGTKEKVLEFFKDRCGRKTKDFANGREARNLFDEARRLQSDRISGASGLTKEAMLSLLPQDIPGTTADKMVSLEEALKELNTLVGLASVKNAVTKISNTLRSQKLTGDTEIVSKHFVFTGNPGTGKTTVARIMANVFNAIGMLPTANLVETDRSKMVASFVGSTAPLVNKQCDSAMGGVLFVDEAYALKQGDGDSFGQEAVDTLLKRMEDDRGKFVVIAAGYSKEMDTFLSSNSGFKSRFTDYINFEDYKPEEMFRIFTGMMKKRGVEFGPGCEDAVQSKLEKLYASRGPDFANARTVRQLFDTVRENVSSRVMAMQEAGVAEEELRKEIRVMLPEDVPGVTEEKSMTIEDALKELNSLVGLGSVKDAVIKIINTLKSQKLTGDTEVVSKHFVFYGNPGTGKTTVARIMANVFKAIGMLPTSKLIETDRSKMVASYVGQTAPLVNKQCDSAMGGVLFVDEAYALKQRPDDSFGQEAVDALLKRMEDDRGKYVVIAAGYTNEMNGFLSSNPGFKSRFTDYINFEDYAVPEMLQIFSGMAKKRSIEYAPGFAEALGARLEEIYASRSASFANARTVRQLFDATRENLSTRVITMEEQGVPEDELRKEIRIMMPEDLGHSAAG